jgi:glutamine synthetase
VPLNLGEAIEAFVGSAFTRAAFGEDVVEHLAHFCRAELAESERVVTDFERRRWFERG